MLCKHRPERFALFLPVIRPGWKEWSEAGRQPAGAQVVYGVWWAQGEEQQENACPPWHFNQLLVGDREKEQCFSGEEHAYLKATGTIRCSLMLEKRHPFRKSGKMLVSSATFIWQEWAHTCLYLVSRPQDQRLRVEPNPCLCPSNILGWELTESNLLKSNRTSLAVQWLRLHASTAGGMGSIPGWGTKIPHATWYGAKKKRNK